MKAFLTILIIALVTAGLRLLPVYLLGRNGRALPQPLLLLSRQLPGAIIGFLVVYSLKDIHIGVPARALPAALTAALLQHYRKNTLLSVFCATAVYMVLLRLLA